MARVAFVLYIKPGFEQEYRNRHARIWPELSEEMKVAGLRAMSIFLLDRKAIVIIEADNYERSAEYLATAAASIRWEKYMADILETESGGAYDPERAWPTPLPLVFDWGPTS